MLGISLVSDAVTGVAEGALGTTKTVDVSEDVRHLPGLQVHQAKLPLRVDEREQTSFEGEEVSGFLFIPPSILILNSQVSML